MTSSYGFVKYTIAKKKASRHRSVLRFVCIFNALAGLIGQAWPKSYMPVCTARMS